MGFGDSLRKWAESKATELLTADSDTRADAKASADAAQSQAKADLGEKLVRTAFPRLGELADEQEARRVAREAADEQERLDDIAALPVATVQLSLTGAVTGQWTGPLALSWEDVEPGDGDPSDPYADRPLAWVSLHAEPPVEVGGMHLSHWSFQLPGFHGDGTYDLTAIAREREAAGAAPEYLEWSMDFADYDDAQFFFHAGAPQSTVTVTDGGRSLSALVGMSGALGDLVATATITRPAPAAG